MKTFNKLEIELYGTKTFIPDNLRTGCKYEIGGQWIQFRSNTPTLS